MGKVFKRIAASPDKGPGQTKNCGFCTRGKMIIEDMIIDGILVKGKSAPCTNCDGTGKVLK